MGGGGRDGTICLDLLQNKILATRLYTYNLLIVIYVLLTHIMRRRRRSLYPVLSGVNIFLVLRTD